MTLSPTDVCLPSVIHEASLESSPMGSTVAAAYLQLFVGRSGEGRVTTIINFRFTNENESLYVCYWLWIELTEHEVSEQMKYSAISADSLSGALSLPYLRVVYLRLSTILNWNWRNVIYWKTRTIWTQIFPPKEQWAIGHQNIGSMNKENNCNYFGTWCCYIGQWYC